MLTGYLRGWGDAIDTWNFVRLWRCYDLLELRVAGAVLTVTGTLCEICGTYLQLELYESGAVHIYPPPSPLKNCLRRSKTRSL